VEADVSRAIPKATSVSPTKSIGVVFTPVNGSCVGGVTSAVGVDGGVTGGATGGAGGAGGLGGVGLLGGTGGAVVVVVVVLVVLVVVVVGGSQF
jgi:hypothetical protein